jgi:hypothetical protein
MSDAIPKAFFRNCNIDFRALMLASDNELLQELSWARQRLTSCATRSPVCAETLQDCSCLCSPSHCVEQLNSVLNCDELCFAPFHN